MVRITLAEIGHEADGLGKDKMSAPDEGLGRVGAGGVVSGPPSNEPE